MTWCGRFSRRSVYKRAPTAERETIGMNRWLVGAGVALILAGLLWPWLSRIPFGRLPGDVHLHRDGWDFYFPLGSSLLVSVVLTLLLWWWRR